jgi:hypothetical protein
MHLPEGASRGVSIASGWPSHSYSHPLRTTQDLQTAGGDLEQGCPVVVWLDALSRVGPVKGSWRRGKRGISFCA